MSGGERAAIETLAVCGELAVEPLAVERGEAALKLRPASHRLRRAGQGEKDERYSPMRKTRPMPVCHQVPAGVRFWMLLHVPDTGGLLWAPSQFT